MDKRSIGFGITLLMFWFTWFSFLSCVCVWQPANDTKLTPVNELANDSESEPVNVTMKKFHLDRRSQVNAYNYAGRTYISLREQMNGSGLVLTVKNNFTIFADKCLALPKLWAICKCSSMRSPYRPETGMCAVFADWTLYHRTDTLVDSGLNSHLSNKSSCFWMIEWIIRLILLLNLE